MKYLTKGELLQTLGESANSFTMFMMNPESFGVTEPMLTKVRVAKQKLDWTNSVDLDTPEIIEMVGLLVTAGVVTQSDADAIMATPNRVGNDLYYVTIKAQDVITVDNAYGAVLDEGMYSVRVLFRNGSTQEIVEEFFRYTDKPTQEMIDSAIADKITLLKAV